MTDEMEFRYWVKCQKKQLKTVELKRYVCVLHTHTHKASYKLNVSQQTDKWTQMDKTATKI